MNLTFSPRAAVDLDEIADYIARDSPGRALRFVQEIRDRCGGIVLAPHGAVRRDDLLPGIRVVPFRRYLIFYTASEDTVRIERVLHGSRDIAELF